MAKVTSLPKRKRQDYLNDPPFTENEEIIENQEIDREALDTMKNQVSLLNKGFVVQIVDIKSCNENDQFVMLKVVLNSTVNQMPVFGNVKIKITRQLIPKLQSELARVS